MTIENDTIRDDRLSWKARGLLAYLLSMPDSWTARIEDLVNRGPDGREAVRTGLVELEQAGYLVRTRERRGDGTFEHYATVHERPVTPRSDFPTADDPTSEDPPSDNPTVRTTDEERPIQDQEMLDVDLPCLKTPEKRARARDVLFEIVAEVCGINWHDPMPKRARDALNSAVRDIRPAWDGTEDQIRRKAAEYRARMPDAELTPNALAKWWPSLSGDPSKIPGKTGAITRAVAERLQETGS